ncbi:MAG: hypothetical protein ABI977_13385 [Acidobacteriota bacterium]
MSVRELELAVSKLEVEELAKFSQWFEDFRAEIWDKQIARDLESGRLDALLKQADEEIVAGQFSKL